ncbi:MAG: ABC-F family ATP-binding cassette domain-containing protein [Bacteroidetes bacterium]|nr:ABC-F family ATP-binding cassette domain-containing protein [Bacteroidota bacterium]
MITLHNFDFGFGGRYLFHEASWQINPGEKIGLIGANGTGKSTLLRIISGEYKIDSGTYTKLRDLSIGFLNQDLLSFSSSENILDVAMGAFESVLKLHLEIEEILEKLKHDHSEELLHLLHDKQTLFDHADGYTIQQKAEAMLEGLGFSTKDLYRPYSEFSGGWRMRVMLAKIMLQKPDVLMLDEPTNHLDLPSIQWIEGYLREYTGTVILVSHDRYFLDNIVDRIVEVANEQITIYPGNYTFYMGEKELRNELQQSQFENQQQYIKEQQKLIDRFRAKASKAKMAQSRIKKLDKLERVEEVSSTNAEVSIRLMPESQPGKVIETIHIKDKSYDTLNIFHNAEAMINRGDKIALIGANGKGKSTLLRMINGSESFDGKIEDGYNLKKSFYAQHQLEGLNMNNTIIQELQEADTKQTENYVRSVAGAFLFGGEDAFKPVKVLSGGEKARVALGKLVLSRANFLILDEPTNHLDMLSVNVLIRVLQEFEGTFITVSHDRFFISEIANKIWWIEGGQIKEYPGTYSEYEYWRTNQANKSKEIKKEKAAPAPVQVKQQKTPVDEGKAKEKKKLDQKLKQLEEKIETLKQKKAEGEQKLSLPSVYGDQKLFAETLAAFNNVASQLETTNKEWEQVFEALEKAD